VYTKMEPFPSGDSARDLRKNVAHLPTVFADVDKHMLREALAVSSAGTTFWTALMRQLFQG
jgi:hypothetical protein